MRRVAAGLVVVSFVVAACSGSDGSGPAVSASSSTAAPATASLTPDGAWTTVAPAAVGLDASALDEIAETARLGKSNCLLVARDGKIAGEWYFRGTTADTAQEVFSITKSFTSTLVGLAVDAGEAALTDRASRWIPEWAGTASDTVTLRDLLSNDSGRSWSIAQDYVNLLRAPDKTAFAVGLAQTSPPGTVWAYNNSAIQTLERVVAGTLGADVPAEAKRRLFDTIGMEHTRMTTDASGHATMYAGIRSTCRDLARLGALFLSRGEWNGREVVSPAWVRQATAAPSTELNAAYGLLWWLNRRGRLAGPLAATSIAGAADTAIVPDAQLVPDAPADTFWALGLGNQLIQVDPGTRTVVVRLGIPERRPSPPTFGPAEASRVVTEAVRHTK